MVVQGAGHVGAILTRHLLEAGANVTVADIHDERVEALASWARQVATDELTHTACDIFSPCALGAVVRPETIDAFRCRIAGAANNQLSEDEMGDGLSARGIVYAPDFAINSGGVINIGEELWDGYDPVEPSAAGTIEQTLQRVFAHARDAGIAPHRAAVQMAH